MIIIYQWLPFFGIIERLTTTRHASRVTVLYKKSIQIFELRRSNDLDCDIILTLNLNEIQVSSFNWFGSPSEVQIWLAVYWPHSICYYIARYYCSAPFPTRTRMSTTPSEIWKKILKDNVEKDDSLWNEYLDKAAVFDVRMIDEWNKIVDVLLVYVGYFLLPWREISLSTTHRLRFSSPSSPLLLSKPLANSNGIRPISLTIYLLRSITSWTLNLTTPLSLVSIPDPILISLKPTTIPQLSWIHSFVLAYHYPSLYRW